VKKDGHFAFADLGFSLMTVFYFDDDFFKLKV